MHRLSLRDLALVGGGVSDPYEPTFLPTDIAGCLRWHKASDLIAQAYNDGDPIDVNWTDHGSGSDDAVPDGVNPPEWEASEVVSTGSEGSIRFTDLHHFDHTEHTLGDISIIAFWKPESGIDTFLSSSTSGNYQVRNQAPIPSPGQSSRPVFFPAAGSVLQSLTAGAEDPTLWHMQAWTREATGGVYKTYHNKQQRSEDTGDTNTTDMKLNTIGLSVAASAKFLLTDYIVYNSQLTQTNINDLFDGYFAIKYQDDL
jgi:hypothetical protein